jgi:hypothetical protein
MSCSPCRDIRREQRSVGGIDIFTPFDNISTCSDNVHGGWKSGEDDSDEMNFGKVRAYFLSEGDNGEDGGLLRRPISINKPLDKGNIERFL